MDFINIEDPANAAKLVGLIVPLLVALVTKKIASSGLKGVLNLGLSAIAGSAAYLVAETGGYDLGGFANATINAFVVSIVAYYGVYRPTGVSESVAAKTSDFGLGKPALQTDDAVEAVEVPVEASAATTAGDPDKSLDEASGEPVGAPSVATGEAARGETQ